MAYDVYAKTGMQPWMSNSEKLQDLSTSRFFLRVRKATIVSV